MKIFDEQYVLRSRKRRKKSLFDDLKINDKVKRVFFSFNKIQTTRDY